MTRGTPWPEGGFVYERVIPALRLIYFYIVLPLAAIQLWIAATHEGLGPAFRGIGRHFVKAFAPRTLLTYALVLVVFGAILYVILFTKDRPRLQVWFVGQDANSAPNKVDPWRVSFPAFHYHADRNTHQGYSGRAQLTASRRLIGNPVKRF